MFGKRIELFKLFGFAVGIDFSWVFLALIVTWSLATGLFPNWFEGLSAVAYWWMGVVGAIGLFASIVFHELAHAMVARNHGVEMRGITLFIFGGVAEMTDEPPSPKAEFQVAIAGPIMSVLISLVCLIIYVFGMGFRSSGAIIGVFGYLAAINGVLALFNLAPAFPLDGGRVLRSILWKWKGSLTWATRVAARIGSGFAVLLIAFGVFRTFTGDLIGGVWFFLIGLFLRGAANMAYRQLLLRRSLEGETVKRFMKTDPITAAPDLTLAELVEDYVYRYHYKMFPVVEGGNLLGCVTTQQIKALPRQEWGTRNVRDVMVACSPDNSVDAGTDAIIALSKMNKSGFSRLLVVENGQLAGVITLKDLLRFLSLKVELEEGRTP